jgi:2-polyprenyl-3-methyl-5-hydroxy-6-metoxy-1,4-benzoquinol methylase
MASSTLLPSFNRTRQPPWLNRRMFKRIGRGVLARIDAALTELGRDPQNLSLEILATVEHLHSGGFAITRRQANRIAVTEDSRVLDVGCGIGGPARYLAHTYGCRVDGIDLTPELIETGRVLT